MAYSISFRIPDEGKGALKVIASLNDSSFNALVDGLTGIRPSLNTEGLANQLLRNQKLLFLAGELPAIGRLLFFLGRNVYEEDLQIPEITEELAGYAVDQDILSKENTSEFVERFQKLFAMPVVKMTAKANAVLTTQPYTYQKARIFTEIRPLFTDDAILVSPSASVIAHQLRLETRHNGSKSELFLALDDRDLLALREVIDRAMRKSSLLAEEEQRFGRHVVTENN